MAKHEDLSSDPQTESGPGELPADTPAEAARVLEETFGFEHFRPGQEEVIGHLLAGRSAAAVFPTGGGKSLCYQIPALLLEGTTLVVSPLIALMKDQLDALHERGAPAARLDSSLDADQVREVTTKLRDGKIRLLYVAPERFANERFRQTLSQVRIPLLAIDEAHCVSEWGHNFRPDYLKLADYGRRLAAETILALTATAPPKVLEDICARFGIEEGCAVRTGFYRANLSLLSSPTTPDERDGRLVERLASRPPGPAIVYATTRKASEEVAADLGRQGFEAMAYHAGMKPDDRARIQDRFLASSSAIVVATIAFGMGIDKADIRYVYHYNLPKSLENLAQEIGRAGRDGEPAICETFYCQEDLARLRNFAHGDVPTQEAVSGLMEAVFGDEERPVLDLPGLGYQNDIRPIVVRTLLTYLELDGWLEAGTPVYSAYSFQPLASSRDILERFDGQRRAFLRGLFKQARKRRIWFEIDLEAAARNLDEPRARLVRALDYLSELGLLELRASRLRHPFRILRRPDDVEALAENLYQRTLDLEERELRRLDRVVELIHSAGCRWNQLCEYFGEERLYPCGHCSYCLDGEAPPAKPLAPRSRSAAIIDEELWTKARLMRREHGEILGPARAFARFLAGLTSPKLSRARLSSRPLFGAFMDVPFAEILERLEKEDSVGTPRNQEPLDS